jgi:hypothetical protein
MPTGSHPVVWYCIDWGNLNTSQQLKKKKGKKDSQQPGMKCLRFSRSYFKVTSGVINHNGRCSKIPATILTTADQPNIFIHTSQFEFGLWYTKLTRVSNLEIERKTSDVNWTPCRSQSRLENQRLS